MLSPGNFGGLPGILEVLRDSGSTADPLLCETDDMTTQGSR